MSRSVGRPNKKGAWQSLKRYSFTVSFGSTPAAHSFLEMHSPKEMLEEFERLLMDAGHPCADPSTQTMLVQSGLGIVQELGTKPPKTRPNTPNNEPKSELSESPPPPVIQAPPVTAASPIPKIGSSIFDGE